MTTLHIEMPLAEALRWGLRVSQRQAELLKRLYEIYPDGRDANELTREVWGDYYSASNVRSQVTVIRARAGRKLILSSDRNKGGGGYRLSEYGYNRIRALIADCNEVTA